MTRSTSICQRTGDAYVNQRRTVPACFKCLSPATIITPTGPMCANCFKAKALKALKRETPAPEDSISKLEE